MKLNENSKILLKQFFDISENEKLLNSNNFDALFTKWKLFVLRTKHDGLVYTSDLTLLLESAKIDYLPYLSKICDHMFWYYPYDTIHIDKNIKEIGLDIFKTDLPYNKGLKMKLVFNGTSDEFLDILGARSLLSTTYYSINTIEVICIDQTLINRARKYYD